MHIHILAIGRLGASPEADIISRYTKRLPYPWEIKITELEDKRRLEGAAKKDAENQLILKHLADEQLILALDEKGKAWTSTEFAQKISDYQMQGINKIAIVIGGADGLGKAVLEKAHHTLCLGRMTWPHMMVRAMIAEQIYRAATIINGHPYHREG